MIKGIYNIFLQGKNNIRTSYNWGEEIKTIGSLGSLKADQTPLISPETTKEEFNKRHKHLTIAKFACLLALIFSVTKVYGDQPIYGTLSAGMATILFLITYIQMSYKSWICQYIWTNWEKRFKLKRPRMGKFFANLMSKPILFFAYKLD